VFKQILANLVFPVMNADFRTQSVGIMRKKTEDGQLINYKLNKKALSAMDIKRKTLACGIHMVHLEDDEKMYSKCGESEFLK